MTDKTILIRVSKEMDRVKWHLWVPVCGTLRGCRTHLSLIQMEDLSLLCHYLQCDSDKIVKRFWMEVKGIRGRT